MAILHGAVFLFFFCLMQSQSNGFHWWWLCWLDGCLPYHNEPILLLHHVSMRCGGVPHTWKPFAGSGGSTGCESSISENCSEVLCIVGRCTVRWGEVGHCAIPCFLKFLLNVIKNVLRNIHHWNQVLLKQFHQKSVKLFLNNKVLYSFRHIFLQIFLKLSLFYRFEISQ